MGEMGSRWGGGVSDISELTCINQRLRPLPSSRESYFVPESTTTPIHAPTHTRSHQKTRPMRCRRCTAESDGRDGTSVGNDERRLSLIGWGRPTPRRLTFCCLAWRYGGFSCGRLGDWGLAATAGCVMHACSLAVVVRHYNCTVTDTGWRLSVDRL